VPTWKSVGLSSGGKMILVESCLSSIPNYSMGIYLLQEEIHHKMDTTGANFFWHGPNMKRKYHMAKWDLMTTPKQAGGAGFTNTRVMNRCLLAKWIIKIERGENTICCNLLRSKYLGETGIFSYKKKSGSQFWKGLMEVRGDVTRSVLFIIGNGRKVRFLKDTWLGGCPLSLTCPILFEICNQREWIVAKVLRDERINLTFRRNFGDKEEREWGELTLLTGGVSLSQESDFVIWTLEKNKEFSTSSLYKEMSFPIMINKWMMNVWRAKLPLKIKIFLWQLYNDKVQTTEQLKKNWSGLVDCKLCGKVESVEHLFLQCAVANFCWGVIRDVLGWGSIPICLEDLYEKLIVGSSNENKNIVFLIGCLTWSLWLNRNNLVFNNSLISTPDVDIFRAISFM
jgi:hypothetical protein